MSSRVKGFLISVIAIAVIILTIHAAFRFVKLFERETYSSAKKECVEYLEENRSQLEDVVLAALQDGLEEHGDSRFDYSVDLEKGLVKFSVDAQGMLGGQYWDLVYTRSGLYENQSESYYSVFDERIVTKGEKLDDHWWFIWRDYDSTELSEK